MINPVYHPIFILIDLEVIFLLIRFIHCFYELILLKKVNNICSVYDFVYFLKNFILHLLQNLIVIFDFFNFLGFLQSLRNFWSQFFHFIVRLMIFYF